MVDTTKSSDMKKDSSTNCKSCGRPMKRLSFRTGSVDKPKEDSLVCNNCGTRDAISS